MSKARTLSKIVVPDPAVADTYLRRNAANTGHDAKTPLQVADELIAVRDWRGRNVLINGDFRIWQEGTSFTDPAGGKHTAEGWPTRGASATGGSYTVARGGYSSAAMGGMRYYLHLTCAGLTSLWYMFHRVEDVRTLAGQAVTLALDTNFDVDGRIEIQLTQNFGSGGSASVTTLSDIKTITSGERRTTFTVTLPSVNGKTISVGNDYLQVAIYLRGPSTDAPPNGAYRFTDIQLEPGSVATPFERRPIGEVLALCQRYFELVPMIARSDASSVYDYYWFKVEKRVAPSLSVFSGGLSGATLGTGLRPISAFRQESTSSSNTDAIIAANARL